MFCNGSWLDEGDLARHGVTTITSRTSLESFSSQPMVTDDIDGLTGPIIDQNIILWKPTLYFWNWNLVLLLLYNHRENPEEN